MGVALVVNVQEKVIFHSPPPTSTGKPRPPKKNVRESMQVAVHKLNNQCSQKKMIDGVKYLCNRTQVRSKITPHLKFRQTRAPL